MKKLWITLGTLLGIVVCLVGGGFVYGNYLLDSTLEQVVTTEVIVKEEAEIAANTQAWPKSNMPELHAQIMSILKAKFPGRKIYRVSVMNDHWNVMYKGLVPERRVVQYWMEYDHKSGRRIAEEHYVCQYYNGNGYGKMQYQGQGSRYFWVAQ